MADEGIEQGLALRVVADVAGVGGGRRTVAAQLLRQVARARAGREDGVSATMLAPSTLRVTPTA